MLQLGAWHTLPARGRGAAQRFREWTPQFATSIDDSSVVVGGGSSWR
jgi:hypothetical protein